MILRTVIAAIICGACAFAQIPVATPTQDAGVNRAVLLDKPEVRVLRVEIDPGATRSMHTHEDVRSHLFLPIAGSIELTMGSAKPVPALVGQSYYMQKGTPHSFKNTGATKAIVYEVFVRDPTPDPNQAAR
jgi:quercetin dioxygenase-like cupin family protein